MFKRKRTWIINVTAVISITLSGFLATYADDTKLNEIASFMIQHSAALEAEVIFGNAETKSLQDEALLTKALAHKKDWRDIYSDYKLLARIIGEHTVILVCTPDGEKALLEDSSCTASFDKYRHLSESSCSISYTPQNICSSSTK